jgi:predicted dienelactone hydrolase
VPEKRKEPPGNRAAPSLGRIVPTEAKPSELSGCILGAGHPSVKNYSKEFNSFILLMLRVRAIALAQLDLRVFFAFLFPLFMGFSPVFPGFRASFPQDLKAG